MAQASVTNYFSSRKRSALDESKVIRAKKVLILDRNSATTHLKSLNGPHNEDCKKILLSNKILDSCASNNITPEMKDSSVKSSLQSSVEIKSNPIQGRMMPKKHRKLNDLPKQSRIQEMFNKMAQKQDESLKSTSEVDAKDIESIKHVTPPSTPTKSGIFVNKTNKQSELSLSQVQRKIMKSSKLDKLKESLARFEEKGEKLKELEKQTAALKSPSLKTFQTIDLEVNLSPMKVQSPEKAYLSPKKDVSIARRNILESLSPKKCTSSIQRLQVLESSTKESLSLPYKYRFLAEVFRAIDTVCQLLYNRKETITFSRLKPAVEKILKRNFFEKHLAQIKTVLPDAFNIQTAKLRQFGTGLNTNKWELTVTPLIMDELMSSEVVLERRRKFYKVLIEKLKDYHAEFLQTLDPPLELPRDGIKRWHPLFDSEKVPDIEPTPLPEFPEEEKFTTGREVLEKARSLFNCNTRMERALLRLKEAQEKNPKPTENIVEDNSILKGVPQALLEKVRQRQAAKALETMTRTDASEIELQMYKRLPEMARIVRNLFVAEKRNVLPFDNVLLGVENSLQSFLSKKVIEGHINLLTKEVPEWLTFLTLRGTKFLKIIKSFDLTVVINKLNELIKVKTEF